MEVLQCDGCDFRAESYDDLKTHIQEVHTVFLQPADADESDSLKDEDEDEEEEEEYEDKDDKDDKDYTPPKAGMSPNSTDNCNQTSQKQTPETHLPFYQCKFCVRYFRSKSFLRNHTKKVHHVVEEDSNASIPSQTVKQPSYTVIMHNDNSKVYSCQYCTYKSPRKARIIKHQLMYHSKVPSEGAEDPSADPGGESDSASGLVKGTFACEWCDYQTDQKDSWTNHVVKEHSDKVKIVSCIAELEGEASASSPKPDSPSASQSPTRSKMNSTGKEESGGKTAAEKTDKSVPEISSFQHAQISAVTPNSTGSSILSKRFASSDVSKSVIEMDANLLNEDSRSSLEDDDDDDEELGDIDDPSYTGTLSADAKQLLTDDDNKLLETKGIPFRKYMNRFQCPFCSFLTMHRRSISRHIENIHLSGKNTVYKCDECPFICTSPLKLGTHKQSHNSSDLETMDLTSDSPDPQNDNAADPVNGGNVSSKVNGKKITSTPNDQQNPHRCTLCSFSTTTLKGLRVHQQHKHSYCDDLDATVFESQLTDQPDSEVDASPIFLQKTQTSILGLATKKPLVTGKRARKSINDLPLDLSSVKKRTRIDEIASNLQSKISQSQQDMIINLDDLDDEDAGENHTSTDKEDREHDNKNPVFTYNTQQLHGRESLISHEGGRIGKRKSNPKSKPRNIPISLTLSDDSENISADPSDSTIQDNADYSEEPGTTRFYCKHCDYHNKSARSVSTHYQRMHPYIKFSFKYILDPEDQSAVFRCLECYIEYTNYNDLHQHYMDHHPEASNVLNFNQPNLVYMCRFCSYTSPNVRSLMPHYQRMHPTVKINNAMIFSSYVVEQSHKTGESQTLREILNSGPKNFNSATPSPRASSSPVLKTVAKTTEASGETDPLKESMGGNVVVYDCDVCSFASPNMHSVLVHYQKKHPEQKASYFRIQKNMKVISVDQSQSVANSSYNLSMTTPPKQPSVALYGSDEEMYYCKHCVYSNRSVVGVLVHYQKRHPEVKVTAKYIKHGAPTPGLMKLMDELQIAAPKQFLKQFQNNGHDGSNNSSPKQGSGEKGEDELFFCQHCDYGNRTVKGVLIHYQKKHRETKANADLVRRHTAVVRSQRERAQMVQSSSISSAAIPAPTDTENATPLRSLKCRHCSYTSPYVYALKKHLKKEHPTVKATAMTILHWAYQDGILEAGYHCEWCIYSHAEPQGLLLHYQRRHPEHNVDYTYMASKLWAGPETTQQGGNLETKHYKCRDCAFEACTIWDITSHYQAVHPWAIKGDESVLLDIIKGNGSAEKIHQQVAKEHTSFNCQSVEDDGSLVIATTPQESHPHPPHPRLSISNNPYQCTVCLSEYNSLHGLLTHYGKKHPGMKVKAADFAQEADINPSSVYKCRHCPYVNSRIHGVLTHYQKRHPSVKVTAEDFADDIEQIPDLNEGDDKCKTQRQGYGAYRCKMCPYTHGTLEKLKIHYEKCHNQSVSDMFTASVTNFSSSKETEPVAECSAGNISSAAKVQEVSELDLALSQLPINKTGKHAIFKCQLCKYFCSTRKGIARHYRIKHNNVRAQPEGKNNVFKCALCSYTNPIRKGLAAHYQKRHDIDAYYTHCLAASKTMGEKPNKVMAPPPSEGDNPEMSEDLRLAVERRRCSLCAFQAFSRKSIVSHYIKRHPGVFPKKQHSSKLGRYFTVIYAKEPEKIAVSAMAEEGKEVLEVPLEPEQDRDVEWLPFKCLKCFRLSFSTGELLSMHYNDHHSNDLKRDFVVSPGPGDEDSELYQCSHCELKFLALPVLAKHLFNHNEEFQKRAMRQERRRQLLSKQKATEIPETKPERESPVNKTPIGFRCNFCIEVHPTLRAICNHLRKHVQYGEVKEGHVKHEVSEVPLTLPSQSLTNGDLEVDEVAEEDDLERPAATMMGHPLVSTASVVATETLEQEADAVDGRAAALVAAARAAVSEDHLKQRLAAGGHPCAQCDRVFMSMQGLRSHERSHSAMALFSREDKYSCQYCQFVSPFRHNLDRHMQSHHGHHKPFKCKLCPFKSAYVSRLKSHLHKAHTGEQHTYKCLSCPFSSMTISQLKEHSLRDHGEALTLPKLRAATQAAHATLRPSRLATNTEQTPLAPDDPSYVEPADVRQQLSHYQLASRSQMSSRSTPGGSAVADNRPDGVLTCEFCEFSSGYMQSLRRHYRDRHGGKKLFKCKECSFFTCYKNTFTMHVEAGHNNSAPDNLPKDLRCPLCLYHTKHKSNMIDHIVLHREERVGPLEVSRSKLSRHLQGLVFRCHKCTFTCSSDQALQMHLQKHAEIKPYQCQLCYFDSSRRSQLEEHLRLEHKVIRNFELMGRVNLDQLEMIKDQESSAEEEEEREMMEMEMLGGEKVAATGGEVEEEEDDEDDDEGMEMMESIVQEQREMGDEEMEDNIKEEEEEEEEEDEEEVKEVEEERPVLQEVLASPTSSTNSTSGPGGVEKRLPCEFCGRCFTNSLEWERHVLRHGMMVNNSRMDTSTAPAIEASASSSTGPSLDTGLDLSSNGKEEGDLSLRSQSQYVEDKEMLDTKKDQQFG
uniref:zinc finger protein 462 n=1 Tax=Scatophagus argus TaxID=75038 RepID=UPI001ED82ED9|nr:zinc finger protein 462 [Scatophagus argus]XP_046230342.1 zinc finger protein 462 [Scatophagus argus]XP_046230343.1 zinc finger protein 462 [Scatophagus argus]XP_046230344.1 zinc finger protein 462 [Scatophagus argus]XP_046230345.1 zinc finger protein 462 [Scatophagus argus]XP_046230346.1 zinc finger protein 462 [Scatophagus argus]XP_046230347.1 zinc finger protein 462 [Scatophagus argus]